MLFIDFKYLMMIKHILLLAVFCLFQGAVNAQNTGKLNSGKTTKAIAQSTADINWMSWEEAQAKMAEEPRKIFVDLYTSWCGWCKKMDASTFKDKSVVSYLNDNFYAVKFNAEQKEPIEYAGHTFQFVNSGRRGYHQLAHSMLNGRMGYPAFVTFNEKMERIMISPGYKKVDQMMDELAFAHDEAYESMSINEYKAERQKSTVVE